jgi:hypothetical protein
MPTLPKPPKLYFYIAGLAIFILILGSVGFYFYQKQNPTAPDVQNSLTSKEEQAKKPDNSSTSVTNPEAQISTASFDADQNTDVIVFEECGISLKVEKTDGLFVLKKRNELFIGIKNKKWIEILECNDSDFTSKRPLKDDQEYLKWLKNLIPQSEIYQNPPNWSLMPSYYFKHDKLYYIFSRTIDSPNKSIISSLKFDTSINNNVSVFIPVDIVNLLEKSVPSVEEYNKKPQSAKDLFLLGCTTNGKILNSSFISGKTDTTSVRCLVTDENWNPLFKLDFAQGSILGKNSLNENAKYILSEDDFSISSGDVMCSQIIEVIKFDFETGLVSKVKTRQPITFIRCAGFNQSSNTICDPSIEYESPPLDIKCFKKDSDYQTYIKEYNEEQAKNKAAQAELAKYLE